MADDTNSLGTPMPKRPTKDTTAGKGGATKRAASLASASEKKSNAPTRAKPTTEHAVAAAPEQPAKQTVTRGALDKAADAVGGRRNVGLIAGGLAVAGAAAAALLSLRGSTPKSGGSATPAKAHQPDGTDSSAQMDAMIADESMIPDATPKA